MISLDVVIVNWNAGNQLLECLQSLSLACQSPIFQLTKCVVVDNASIDGSLERLESDRLTLIKNRENKGFAYACNQAAKAGKADFILFLNPDVRLFPDSLAKALAFMAEPKNERVGILGIQLVDQQGIIQRNVARFPTPKSLFHQMLGLDRLWPKQYPAHFMTDWDHQESREVDQVQGSFFLVRRKVFDELQGFDQRFFMYYEDLDFAFRAKQADWKIYYLADTKSFHRGGGTSHQVKAKRLFHMLYSRVQYAAKHFDFGTTQVIIIVSVGLEFWIRLGWSLIHLSGTAGIETIQAYSMFIKEISLSYFSWVMNRLLSWFPVLRLIANHLRSFRRIFAPKVGVLEQYPPRSLFIPEMYLKTPDGLAGKLLPSISIVTPSYNQGEFIERTIRSILDQEYPHLEYIVQDGNSKDGTLAVLKSFQQKLTHFDSQPDNGQAHAINLGFQRTSGEIMAYLNSDDILLPGTLRYVADYFLHHPEVDVVYSHRVIINEEDLEIGRWVLPSHDNEILLWSDYVPQETLFWRRSLWEKVGAQLNESFQFALDWDLLVRFRATGANFKRLPRFLAAFRLQPQQKTNLQMNSVGISEMNHLRKQIHGHEVSWEEISKNSTPYLLRSIIYHKLYRLGIFRY